MTDDIFRVLDGARGRRRVLFLDYDGTLVPFADKPHLAYPDPELLELLGRLSARSDTAVHIVSGRSRTSIDAWLGHLGIGLHAEHGSWSRLRPNLEWRPRLRGAGEWLLSVRDVMRASVAALPLSLVEEKESCIAWHYRLVEPGRALSECARLRTKLQPLVDQHDLELLAGASVLEVRERGVHKGHVVREIAGTECGAFHIAIGDDVTDDDMFAALPEGGFAIAASHRPARAHLRVPDFRWVRALLRRLHEESATAKPQDDAQDDPA